MSQNADIAAAAASAAQSTMLDDALGGGSNGSAENSLQRKTSASHMQQQQPQLAHSADYFTSESLMDRMKQYAAQGGIPLDYMDRYAAYKQHGSSDGQDE